jgi:hypothetical protein
MSASLIEAGVALANLLTEENRLLSAMQLGQAGRLNPTKQLVIAKFLAAQATAGQTTAHGAEATALRRLSDRLEELGTRNRALLERALAAQARLIDCIAAAARPAGPGYAPPPSGERPAAFAINARA